MPAQLKDFGKLLLPPEGGVKEIICSQAEEKDKAKKGGAYLFAVFQLQDGSFAAAWADHHQVVKKKEDLDAILNVHEKTLLRYGIKE